MALQFGAELLTHPQDSLSARAILGAMQQASPIPVCGTATYQGQHRYLMLWGYGRDGNAEIVRRHVARGGHAILWDLGYFRRAKTEGYFRMSVDRWHPQTWLDATPNDGSRFQQLNIPLRKVSDPNGPIIVAAMGKKSQAVIGKDWESDKAAELAARFPGRQVIIRSKGNPTPIAQALMGASMLVCRHSNCAVDAVVAGVPIECEDGAAKWLDGKPYKRRTRKDFLNRLAYWQWKASEAAQAWQFILKVTNED